MVFSTAIETLTKTPWTPWAEIRCLFWQDHLPICSEVILSYLLETSEQKTHMYIYFFYAE